jgi:DNA helicase-2/ATP-dependent DNA helicase PcrA
MDKLSSEQCAIVQSDARIRIVVAGPGSGKSRVLVERVVYLVGRGVHPRNIIILTFTNGAAHVLVERLAAIGIIGIGYVGTLHGWCLRLIHEFGDLMGYRANRVSIVTEAAQKQMLDETKKKLGSKISDKALWENNTPDANLIWNEYQHTLKRCNMVDYDGILTVALDLIQRFPEVTDVLKKRVQAMLVDEMQDSNLTDWCIYDAVPAATKFLVGDPDQSCFAFRGARPDIIMDWAQDDGYETMPVSYRCGIEICDAATQLIAYNNTRIPKAVLPAPGVSKGHVEVVRFPDAESEIYAAALAIASEAELHGDNFDGFAVLARTNDLVEHCQKAFKAHGVPVRNTNRVDLPKDWNFTLSCLSLLVDPSNDYHAEQVLRGRNVPQLQINECKLKALRDGTALSTSALLPNTRPATINDASIMLFQLGVSEESMELIRQRIDVLATDMPTVSDLVADLWKHESWTVENDREGVSVLTIHGAKGKEFDHVFVIGCEEGILPSLKIDSDMEEERRLMFVAITRARHHVTLSHAAKRVIWNKPTVQIPSRFLEEIR